jgi:hypothetical protein
LHFQEKRVDGGDESMSRIGLSEPLHVSRSGQVKPLPIRASLRQRRERSDNEFIYACGALAATHHQGHGTCRVQPQSNTTGGRVEPLKLGTYRGPGDDHLSIVQTGRGGGESYECTIDDPGQPAVGPAWDGIRFVKESSGVEKLGR